MRAPTPPSPSGPATPACDHTPRALIEEDVAEHLVVDQDGRLRFRYSHDAAAAALEAMAEPAEGLKEVVCPVLHRARRGARTC